MYVCMCVCMCVGVCACACVCVCVRMTAANDVARYAALSATPACVKEFRKKAAPTTRALTSAQLVVVGASLKRAQYQHFMQTLPRLTAVSSKSLHKPPIAVSGVASTPPHVSAAAHVRICPRPQSMLPLYLCADGGMCVSVHSHVNLTAFLIPLPCSLSISFWWCICVCACVRAFACA